jgi:hypothetical protein
MILKKRVSPSAINSLACQQKYKASSGVSGTRWRIWCFHNFGNKPGNLFLLGGMGPHLALKLGATHSE